MALNVTHFSATIRVWTEQTPLTILFRRLQALLSTDHCSRQLPKPLPGEPSVRWSRLVMTREIQNMLAALPLADLHALEISGDNWRQTGFKSYRAVQFPDYDICERALPQRYDIIIADQVLEHVLWPYRAVKHAYTMLEPGGYFLVSTPFLVRIHNCPVDLAAGPRSVSSTCSLKAAFLSNAFGGGRGETGAAWWRTSHGGESIAPGFTICTMSPSFPMSSGPWPRNEGSVER